MDEGEIIILSEDDDDLEHDQSCNEPSVLIVEEEDVQNSDCAVAPTVLDEDLVVTFTRRADVLPHARYDCPIHPFTATDCRVSAPVAGNQLVCDQCFCYICDKPASSCAVWCHQGVCHCNSHKKSDYWSHLRNTALLGTLSTFNLTLSEIDTHLRHAETMLQSFRVELSTAFTSFMKGKPAEEFGQRQSNQKGLIHDYTPVYECVSLFLSKADEQEGRAGAIMSLGAAEDFIRHFHATGTVTVDSPMTDVAKAKMMLLQRVLTSVQKQIVMSEFTSEFTLKLQGFYKKLYLPPELRSMRNSLCVRPWNDVLLVSVLKGQNVSGFRRDKGKKDVLIEQMPVILLRTELLQRQNRYRELSRYLRVVQADDPKLFQQVQDLVPFFLCKEGDFLAALHCLFSSLNGPAARFTPRLFQVYLRIFDTATAPNLMITQQGQLCCPDAVWQPVKDAVPMRRSELVKFALRLQRCCPAVNTDSQCWAHVLTIFNTPAQPKPSSTFLQVAKDAVWSVLLDQQVSNIQIPRFFHEVYSDQALLLLVTGALGLRIHDAALSPALPVLMTYKENVWAFAWLCDCLASNGERMRSFYQEIEQEIQNSTDGDYSLPFLHSISPAQSSSPESWDHTYCSPAADELCLSQVKSPSQCHLVDLLKHC